MANSKYEYVKSFEAPDPILPNVWTVVRIDGWKFHSQAAKYKWKKPNDHAALALMNSSAHEVMSEVPDICIAYGTSDEYSKILSIVVSIFSATYISRWPQFFHNVTLTPPLPAFDGRVVLYPSDSNLRDYLSWRQADCHINNLYNTAFWALIQKGGCDHAEAEKRLSGTLASDKNEILHGLKINYNREDEMFKKGTIVFKDYEPPSPVLTNPDTDASNNLDNGEKPRRKRKKPKSSIKTVHVDLIRDKFWDERPWILCGEKPVFD